MQEYIKAWQNYANFKGRARRREYWMFYLFNIIASAAFGLVDGLVGADSMLILIYTLAVLLPSLAVQVRRLHDTGRSGWWWFISFIPFVGGIWLLVLMFFDSVPDNEYGPNPKKIG